MLELILNWINFEARNNVHQFKISEFRDIQMEIGYGMGQFLIQEALIRKDSMFVGFDIKPHCFEQVVKYIGTHQLSNVLVFNCDAVTFIKNQVPDKLIDILHIYFPQYSVEYCCERIITKESMHEYDRILNVNAQFKLVTDIRRTFSTVITNIPKNKYYLTEWVPFSHVKDDYFVNSVWGMKVNASDGIFYLNGRKKA